MMRWLRLALLAALLAILTSRFPAGATTAGLAPLWLLLPGLLAGVRSTPGRAAAIGWGFGLVADLLSIEPLGVHAFVFGAASCGLARVRGLLFSDHPVTQAVVAGALALMASLLLLLRLEIASEAFGLFARLPSAVLAAAFTGVVFPAVVWLDGKAGIIRGFRERDAGVQA